MFYLFYSFFGPGTYSIASDSKFRANSRSRYANPSNLSLEISFSVFNLSLSNAIHHFPSYLSPSSFKTTPKRWTLTWSFLFWRQFQKLLDPDPKSLGFVHFGHWPTHLSKANPSQQSQPIPAKPTHLSKANPSQQSQPISAKPAHLSKVNPSQQSQPISEKATHLRKSQPVS